MADTKVKKPRTQAQIDAFEKARLVQATNRALKKAAGSPPIKKVKIVAPDPKLKIEDVNTPDNAALFDVEQAPDTVFPEDSALDKVFKKLGLKGATTEKKEDIKALPTAKLTKAQQSLYDSFAPLAIQAFIVTAGWAWSFAGPEYVVLAPNEEVAEKIIAPLMRIYARTSKIAASLNPNHTDAAASLAALVGYAWMSITLYQQIKEEKELAATNGDSANSGLRPLNTNEAGHGSADNGRHAARANSSVNGSAVESNGHAGDSHLSSLSDNERRQYEALSLLRQRDIESRARRSGSN